MADRWIKLPVSAFDDERLKLIASQPNSEHILLLWFRILCLAGKVDADGVLMVSGKVPLTESMIASLCGCDVETVSVAVNLFCEFGLLFEECGVFAVSNWDEFMFSDKIEAAKKKHAEVQRNYRARQNLTVEKCVASQASDITVMSQDGHSDSAERDQRKETERKKNLYPASDSKRAYGSFSNVLLSDSEVEKLREGFPDWEKRIESLSEYIASKGKRYRNHYATLLSWARKEGVKSISEVKEGALRCL